MEENVLVLVSLPCPGSNPPNLQMPNTCSLVLSKPQTCLDFNSSYKSHTNQPAALFYSIGKESRPHYIEWEDCLKLLSCVWPYFSFLLLLLFFDTPQNNTERNNNEAQSLDARAEKMFCDHFYVLFLVCACFLCLIRPWSVLSCPLTKLIQHNLLFWMLTTILTTHKRVCCFISLDVQIKLFLF